MSKSLQSPSQLLSITSAQGLRSVDLRAPCDCIVWGPTCPFRLSHRARDLLPLFPQISHRRNSHLLVKPGYHPALLPRWCVVCKPTPTILIGCRSAPSLFAVSGPSFSMSSQVSNREGSKANARGLCKTRSFCGHSCPYPQRMLRTSRWESCVLWRPPRNFIWMVRPTRLFSQHPRSEMWSECKMYHLQMGGSYLPNAVRISDLTCGRMHLDFAHSTYKIVPE